MAFKTQDDGDDVMGEINVTPLVDVMLVLLVVFIVTAPLLTQAVHVNLPKTAETAPPEEKAAVYLSIDAQGKIFIDKGWGYQTGCTHSATINLGWVEQRELHHREAALCCCLTHPI